MAFNVSEFIQKFPKDGARPNLFEILLPDYYGTSSDYLIKCRASSIPGSNIGQVGAYYFGRVVKFAGSRSFNDWTVTVMMDEDDYQNGVRSYLENWMSGINSHVGNKRNSGGYLKPSTNDGYFAEGTVKHYGKSGDVIATYLMKGCFPVAISEIPLDWGQNNMIAEFNVTFAMQWWERKETTDSDS